MPPWNEEHGKGERIWRPEKDGELKVPVENHRKGLAASRAH